MATAFHVLIVLILVFEVSEGHSLLKLRFFKETMMLIFQVR